MKFKFDCNFFFQYLKKWSTLCKTIKQTVRPLQWKSRYCSILFFTTNEMATGRIQRYIFPLEFEILLISSNQLFIFFFNRGTLIYYSPKNSKYWKYWSMSNIKIKKYSHSKLCSRIVRRKCYKWIKKYIFECFAFHFNWCSSSFMRYCQAHITELTHATTNVFMIHSKKLWEECSKLLRLFFSFPFAPSLWDVYFTLNYSDSFLAPSLLILHSTHWKWLSPQFHRPRNDVIIWAIKMEIEIFKHGFDAVGK